MRHIAVLLWESGAYNPKVAGRIADYLVQHAPEISCLRVSAIMSGIARGGTLSPENETFCRLLAELDMLESTCRFLASPSENLVLDFERFFSEQEFRELGYLKSRTSESVRLVAWHFFREARAGQASVWDGDGLQLYQLGRFGEFIEKASASFRSWGSDKQGSFSRPAQIPRGVFDRVFQIAINPTFTALPFPTLFFKD